MEGITLAGRILEWQLKNDIQFPSVFDQDQIGEGNDSTSKHSDVVNNSFLILFS
jgi:hypothetical protein